MGSAEIEVRVIEPLGVELPIVQGPMSGGPSTPALAAAVSGAGGLGFLGEGYALAEQIRRDIEAVRALTSKPFGVNLFVPAPFEVDGSAIERAIEVLAPYRDALGLGEQTVPATFSENFGEQLAIVLDSDVPVFTVTFGTLSSDVVEAFQRRGTVVGVTATTPAEAVAGWETGVDFIVAQGAEAGGHRGSFLDAPGDDLIGLTALVPQVLDVTGLPVVAAGGVMDGRGVRSVLDLGACAAQLGTAFLLSPEAGTSGPYREAVRVARAEDTVITRAFSGRRARGIVNCLAQDLADRTDLPPYPVMNALTRDLRRVAAERGDASVLSLWAGQGVGLAREMPAAELVGVLAAEAGLIGGGA